MYGLNDPVTEIFGKRCLMARKLVEKGVRFVQLYTPSQSWDGHTEIVKNHTKNAAETDKPIAALIKDLKRRGLLDSTLLVWMGEFGRTPDNPADLRDKAGRDHNTRAMTIWFAGGGIKPGTLVGATDDLGFKAVEDIYRMRDVHATVLHLMGLNDMRLTYYSAGRNQRLTDTGGKVIQGGLGVADESLDSSCSSRWLLLAGRPATTSRRPTQRRLALPDRRERGKLRKRPAWTAPSWMKPFNWPRRPPKWRPGGGTSRLPGLREIFREGNRNANPDMASCGKAFTSIACGIMLKEKHDLIPQGLDTKVFTKEYLPEAFPLDDPAKADITFGQLLAMTAGFHGESTK